MCDAEQCKLSTMHVQLKNATATAGMKEIECEFIGDRNCGLLDYDKN